MTIHEEKAREIVIKMQFQKEPLNFEQAKNCGLIAVDEIVKALNDDIYIQGETDIDSHREYWLEVRSSLNAL